MFAYKESQHLATNQILAALPRQEYKHLFANLEMVRLDRGKILYDLGDTISYAFFPMSGMVSLLSITEEGSTTQVSMVGNEGIAGIAAVLKINTAPFRVMVQIPGKAMRVRINILIKEFDRGGPLQDMMLRYLHSLITQISQSAACNRFHTVEQRLCRWLLISHDRVKANTLQLTQEALSHMIGASRTNITEAAYKLKAGGLIQYRRGDIQVIERQGIEKAACECYRIVTEEIGRLCVA